MGKQESDERKPKRKQATEGVTWRVAKDDTEGHSYRTPAEGTWKSPAEGVFKATPDDKDDEDDDTEGHGFKIQSPSSRGE
jgi:hypothetical protein